MFDEIKKRDRRLLIKLTSDERQAIEKAAVKSEVSMSELVRMMIKAGFEKLKGGRDEMSK